MNTSANKSAETDYLPEPGDTAWQVINFLKSNPDEYLTAIDIGVKFDVAPDLVGDKLRRAVVYEYLRRSTNGQGAAVWKLGARPVRLAPLASGATVTPQPQPQRYAGRVSLPTINKGVPLMDEETRKRNEVNTWLMQFEPGDSATFGTEAEIDEMRKAVARFRKDQPDRYFNFVQTGPAEWGMERRSGPPAIGRKKGAPAAPVAAGKKKGSK